MITFFSKLAKLFTRSSLFHGRAARFHDIGKAHDRHAHDIAGYNFMLRRDPLAAYFVLRHMGRWGSREVADILECKPIARYHAVPVFRWLADVLCACDYTAAHGWTRMSA